MRHHVDRVGDGHPCFFKHCRLARDPRKPVHDDVGTWERARVGQKVVDVGRVGGERGA